MEDGRTSDMTLRAACAWSIVLLGTPPLITELGEQAVSIWLEQAGLIME
jgi:hypothetical protein